MPKNVYFQSNRFQATPAQKEYLRCVHHGIVSDTNGATRNRCFRFLVFEGGKVSVKPEIVKALQLER